VKGHLPWVSPGSRSAPAENPMSFTTDFAPLLGAQGWIQTPPASGELFHFLQLPPSPQKEDVTQQPCNGLFLVTSAPSPVTFHTTKWREWDASPLPGRPRAGLSEPGSLLAVKRNLPCRYPRDPSAGSKGFEALSAPVWGCRAEGRSCQEGHRLE